MRARHYVSFGREPAMNAAGLPWIIQCKSIVLLVEDEAVVSLF
jgi:hypothetical protein